jgi:hypothetical protein
VFLGTGFPRRQQRWGALDSRHEADGRFGIDGHVDSEAWAEKAAGRGSLRGDAEDADAGRWLAGTKYEKMAGRRARR